MLDTLNMSSLAQLVVILTLAMLLCVLTTRGENEKLPSEAIRNKGLYKLFRHRPWYSGKRDMFSLNNEVRRTVIPADLLETSRKPAINRRLKEVLELLF